MRLPRLRTLAIPLIGVVTTLSVTALPAHAEDIDPVGAGDFIPSPRQPVEPGTGTLYEEYGGNLGLWMLDTDYGIGDFHGTIHWIADLFMSLTLLVTRAAIVVVQWMFELLTIPALQDAIANSISGASETLMATVLPAALVIGALVAFSGNRQARGSQLGQLAWLGVSTIFAISLLTTPHTWTGAIDSARQLGADVALNAGAAGIGDGVDDFPFEMDHDPVYSEDQTDTMQRKSADAIWRTYAATPWCLAEFGSLEVCEDHGLPLLQTGSTNTKERKDMYLHENVSTENVGRGSVSWRQGKNPVGRMLITMISFIAVLIFAALVIALAFASLASLVGALMLLVAGVFFACMWCIPGRPRQWGVKWFDYVLGFTLQSAVAMLVLITMLVLQAAIATLLGEFGWLICAVLSIIVGLSAWRFRRIVEAILGVSGTLGPGAMIAGLLAARGATRLMGGMARLGGRGVQAATQPGALRRRGPTTTPQRPQPPGPLQGRIDRIPRPPGGPQQPQIPARNSPQLLPGGSGAGVPRPSPAPLPAGGAAAPLPSGDQSTQIGRGRSVADGPPAVRSVPAGAGRTRPGTDGAHARPGDGTTLRRPAPPQPGPVLRPGQGDAGSYTFRQGPPPGAAAPRVIRGEAVRGTETRLSGRAGRGPVPAAPGRRRPAPAPTPRQRNSR